MHVRAEQRKVWPQRVEARCVVRHVLDELCVHNTKIVAAETALICNSAVQDLTA